MKHFVLIIGLLFFFHTSAQSFEFNGIRYDILSESEKTCKIAQMNRGLSGDIVLPSVVTDSSTGIEYTLIEIGSYAFLESYYIESVTIPNTVTTMWLSAFSSCLIMPSLYIPSSVSEIVYGGYVGQELYALEKIEVSPDNPYYDSRDNCKAIIDSRTNELILGSGNTVIPSSVTSIGDFAFYMRKNLESITIPESVVSIGEKAFYGCNSLESVTLPSGVETIGNNAFTECQTLQYIYISETVSKIGNAFASCPQLRQISISKDNPYYDSRGGCNAIIETASNKMILASNSTTFIPNTVTAIGDCAFNFYEGIKTLVVPESVGSIGIQAFFQCTNLVSITLPAGLTKLSMGTFSGCSSLKNVVIPGTVDTLMTDIFYNCSSLENIVIPKSVSLIRGDMFEGCTNLSSIAVEEGNAYFDSRGGCNAIVRTSSNEIVSGCANSTIPFSVKSIGAAAFRGRHNIETFVIPDQIESIGIQSFAGCSALKSITLPKNLKAMGNAAFDGCNSLESVYSKIENPFSFGTYVWNSSVLSSATLYVPVGCKDKYTALDDWKEFKEIFEFSTDIAVTDISQHDNAIYIEPFTARVGDSVDIEVRLKNEGESTAYGFALTLPEGMSIATESDGSFDEAVTLTSRNSRHTVTTNHQADGSYKIAVASLSSKPLTGNDGIVLTIRACVADDMPIGDYAITVSDPLIVSADGTKPAIKATITKVTIEDYIKGDVDGDGIVDLADAVFVINNYVGKAVASFVAQAADVDGDGIVDLADAVRIINYYVGKIDTLSRKKMESKTETLIPQ